MKKAIIGLILCMFLIGIVGFVGAENKNITCDISGPSTCGKSCEINSDCAPNGACGACINKDVKLENKNNITLSCAEQKPGKCICQNKQCVYKEDEEENENKTNQGLGQIIRNRVHAGVYTSPEGVQIRVSEMAQNRTRLMVGNKSADCNECNISEERENNKTRLKIHLSNGKEKEIKIMPNKASEKALERLKSKSCNETNNCTIQLKEVGKKNETRAAYEVQIERHYKLLGLFKIKALNKAQVDSETGDTIIVKKPWWAFLATNSD